MHYILLPNFLMQCQNLRRRSLHCGGSSSFPLHVGMLWCIRHLEPGYTFSWRPCIFHKLCKTSERYTWTPCPNSCSKFSFFSRRAYWTLKTVMICKSLSWSWIDTYHSCISPCHQVACFTLPCNVPLGSGLICMNFHVCRDEDERWKLKVSGEHEWMDPNYNLSTRSTYLEADPQIQMSGPE